MRAILSNKYNWFIIFFLSFFLSEAIYKWLIDEGLKHIRIAGTIKLLAQTLMLIVIIKNYKQNHAIIKLISILCVSFIIGQISLPDEFQNIMHLEYLNNSIFIFLMFLFFKNINLTLMQKTKALTFYEAIVLVNSVAVVLGFMFSIAYFKTYNGMRFGYDGFLIKSSYASYFYIMAMFYFSHKFFVQKKTSIFLLILILSAALLTGTKANLLAFVLCLVYMVLKTKIYKHTIFWLVLITLFTIFIYFFNSIYNYFLSTSEIFKSIIHEDGITTALFSFRNQILIEELIPFVNNHWSISNYLFGGLGDIMVKSGLDFIDLFYYFGLFGATVYIYIIIRLFKAFEFRFNFDSYYFIFMIISVVALGGNFFYNSSVAISLMAVIFYFEILKNENKHS